MFARVRGQARRDAEAGFTLAELLVSMIVMALICSMVSTIVIATVRETQSTLTRNDQGNQARVGMEGMSKALRTAVVPVQVNDDCSDPTVCDNAFIQGTPFSLSFFADINNTGGLVGPSRVTFAVSGTGVLTETIQRPDPASVTSGNFSWTGANLSTCTVKAVGCLKLSQVLATGVQTNGAALFTYYQYGTSTAMTGTTFTAAQLQNVDSIDVQLTVQLPNRPAVRATVLVQRIALSNVDVYVENQS